MPWSKTLYQHYAKTHYSDETSSLYAIWHNELKITDIHKPCILVQSKHQPIVQTEPKGQDSLSAVLHKDAVFSLNSPKLPIMFSLLLCSFLLKYFWSLKHDRGKISKARPHTSLSACVLKVSEPTSFSPLQTCKTETHLTVCTCL